MSAKNPRICATTTVGGRDKAKSAAKASGTTVSSNIRSALGIEGGRKLLTAAEAARALTGKKTPRRATAPKPKAMRTKRAKAREEEKARFNASLADENRVEAAQRKLFEAHPKAAEDLAEKWPEAQFQSLIGREQGALEMALRDNDFEGTQKARFWLGKLREGRVIAARLDKEKNPKPIRVTPQVPALSVGSGRPGQKFEHGGSVIETTLHEIKLPRGPVPSSSTEAARIAFRKKALARLSSVKPSPPKATKPKAPAKLIPLSRLAEQEKRSDADLLAWKYAPKGRDAFEVNVEIRRFDSRDSLRSFLRKEHSHPEHGASDRKEWSALVKDRAQPNMVAYPSFQKEVARVTPQVLPPMARIPVGSGRPGQKFEHGGSVIETTLHEIKLPLRVPAAEARAKERERRNVAAREALERATQRSPQDTAREVERALVLSGLKPAPAPADPDKAARLATFQRLLEQTGKNGALMKNFMAALPAHKGERRSYTIHGYTGGPALDHVDKINDTFGTDFPVEVLRKAVDWMRGHEPLSPGARFSITPNNDPEHRQPWAEWSGENWLSPSVAKSFMGIVKHVDDQTADQRERDAAEKAAKVVYKKALKEGVMQSDVKGMVTITSSEGPLRVPGTRYGKYAVNRVSNDPKKQNFWNVTHMATGLAIVQGLDDKATGKKIALWANEHDQFIVAAAGGNRVYGSMVVERLSRLREGKEPEPMETFPGQFPATTPNPIGKPKTSGVSLTPDERKLLLAIEKDGKNGSVRMPGLSLAAKSLIDKGLAYKVGTIGGGSVNVHSTVKGSAAVGYFWDGGYWVRPSVEAPKPKGPKLPRFRDQKKALLEGLNALGWEVVSHLKTPHATDPATGVRFWFKPQAIYWGRGTDFANARSWTDDSRSVTVEHMVSASAKDPSIV